MMAYLKDNDSYFPNRYLIEFTVEKYHVGKTLALTFQSTDGVDSLKKPLNLKFEAKR
jgi:hypothetical protein